MAQNYDINEISLTAVRLDADPMIFDGSYQVITFLRTVDAAGILQPQAVVFIRAGADSEMFPIYPGQSFRVPRRAKRIFVSWPAQPGFTATFGLADEPSWIVPQGVVISTPLSSVETLNGQSFIGKDVRGAVVANYSHSQLWNAPASGVQLVVSRVVAWSTTANILQIALRYSSADLGASTFGLGRNKLLGSTAPVATLRGTDAVTQQGNFLSSEHPDGEPIVFDPPLIVPEGTGLIAVPGIVNAGMYINYQWREKPV